MCAARDLRGLQRKRALANRWRGNNSWSVGYLHSTPLLSGPIWGDATGNFFRRKIRRLHRRDIVSWSADDPLDAAKGLGRCGCSNRSPALSRIRLSDKAPSQDLIPGACDLRQLARFFEALI